MIRRRRLLSIAAAAALVPARPGHATAISQWRGVALGADASITLAHPDAERIIEAIQNTAESVQEVRRRFNLNEVAIVLLSDIDKPDNPVAEAVEVNREAIDELRVAIEGSAMFFHAIDSRNILLQNVLAMEFDEDDVIIFAIGGGEVR